MKKSTVTISILMTCILFLTIIAGCGQIQTNSSTPASSQPKTEPGATVTYAKELMVFAASGTKPAVDAAAKLFEEKYGTKVTVNYGGGGEILSNMVMAKKGDVFIAPEQKFMDSAKKQGAVDNNTKITSMAFMIPVIGVKVGNPQNIISLADLGKTGLKIVMGNPETTLLGILAPEIMKKASVYDSIKPNIVTNAPQVNAIITMLKMNQVDAGFIWHYFGTSSATDVGVIWIPKEYVTGTGEIQGAVSSYSQENKTAEQFIDFLVSAEGKDIFKKNGYIVDRQEAAKYWLSN
jgi:molybdate transport system substrate-binding protein